MTQEMLIMAAILVAVILLTFIGILSRYRKCKSDEVLVVYGKTGGEKKSAKLYHGGTAFVWPIIQGYEFLSMKPMQIDCKLTGALSAQNIRVDVPTTITVAISTDAEVMQNAAERMLGLTMDDKQNLITDVVYGQMRLVIADKAVEYLTWYLSMDDSRFAISTREFEYHWAVLDAEVKIMKKYNSKLAEIYAPKVEELYNLYVERLKQ